MLLRLSMWFKEVFCLAERKALLMRSVKSAIALLLARVTEPQIAEVMKGRWKNTIVSSISIELGKGVLNHNNRKFIAENVDRNRTKNNIKYASVPLEEAYQTLFGEALARYNERQKRSDRRIDNYLKHIQNSKQEKPFYEIIVQIGNREDMGHGSCNEDIATAILDE